MSKSNTKPTNDEMKAYRIEVLRRIIPELYARREKKAGQRLLITFVALFVLSFIVLFWIWKDAPIFTKLLFSLIISVSLMILSYAISSFSFCKNLHETMIIEKLKTELYTLTDDGCENGDMLYEINKIRGPIF